MELHPSIHPITGPLQSTRKARAMQEGKAVNHPVRRNLGEHKATIFEQKEAAIKRKKNMAMLKRNSPKKR